MPTLRTLGLGLWCALPGAHGDGAHGMQRCQAQQEQSQAGLRCQEVTPCPAVHDGRRALRCQAQPGAAQPLRPKEAPRLWGRAFSREDPSLTRGGPGVSLRGGGCDLGGGVCDLEGPICDLGGGHL